jgi:Lrp/AsnC family transcriptional regulator
MGTELDKIDIKILKVLQENATKSASEIAGIVGLSQSPCWRRIQRLKEMGYISKIVAILNREKLNLSAQFFVQVKVVEHTKKNITAFANAILDFPEVIECHVVLGAYDFLLRVVARDIRTYEEFFFERLSKIPGIREVNTNVTVSEIKTTTALPI